MKISKIAIYRYKTPFKESLCIKGQVLLVREGILVRILTDDGLEGLGEISPLPGLYPCTLTDALTQLREILPLLLGGALGPQSNSQEKYLPESISGKDLFSSVRFGLEMAFLNLAGCANNTNFGKLISPECLDSVEIHGLLQGDILAVSNSAKELMTKGFKSFKIKASEDIEYDIKKLKAVSVATGNKALLHLDCNQKWNLKDSLKNSDFLREAPLLYIEEPFKNIEEIPEFYQETLIPIALDETLLNFDFEDIKSIDGFEYLVIKPQLIGGIEKTFNLAARCHVLGITPIISSSFETELGIQALSQIAGAIKTNHSCGLNTLKYFEESILINGVYLKKSVIDLKKKSISFDDLEKEQLREDFYVNN